MTTDRSCRRHLRSFVIAGSTLAVVAIGLDTGDARAETVLPGTEAQMQALASVSRTASTIIVGTVVDTTQAWAADGLFGMDGVIVTVNTIAVDSTLKGVDLPVRSVSTLGGSIGSFWFSSGESQLEIGSSYLLFLNRCGGDDFVLLPRTTALCESGLAHTSWSATPTPLPVLVSIIASAMDSAEAAASLEGRGDGSEAVLRQRLKSLCGDSVEGLEPVPHRPPEGCILASFDTPPELVQKVPAEYPESARLAQAEGVVQVLITIDEAGRVVDAAVQSSDAIDSLQEAAMTAARKWVFTPAKRGNTPVEARIVIPFQFSLD